MPRANGWERTWRRTRSKPESVASALGLAMIQILQQIGDRDANVRLLVIDAIKAVTLEKRDYFVRRTFSDDDIAAHIENRIVQAHIDKPLPEIGAPIFALAVE